MNRWEKIEALFQEAIERPADEREIWLRQACGDDSDLRREVASLVANHRAHDSFEPWAAAAATQLIVAPGYLAPGQPIGPYQILEPIGAGGMGEVYRARDSKLHRDVALKVLPEAFADDADRLTRFSREARVLASLNHPNIAAIYGVEGRALVMEFVDGPTLAERMTGRIALDEALTIARQIADALEYAHEKGIVHRDLKPANIKLTSEGRVKVLDFGLAKALGSEPSSGGSAPPPTFTMQGTAAGVIIGTASYMAPEQARGRPADKRADIWSFGVILYEMLSGERLFPGETVSETLAAVLRDNPRWERVPAQARNLLRLCLEKDSKKRLRDIGDAWHLLENAAAPPVRRSFTPVAWITCALLALAAAVLAWMHFRESTPAVEAVRFRIDAPDGVTVGNGMSISPNGKHVVLAGTNQAGVTSLWIRSLDVLEPRRLSGSEGANPSAIPAWSPDSRFIAFVEGTRLKKIAISDGAAQTICEVPGGVTWVAGSWTADGRIIFADAHSLGMGAERPERFRDVGLFQVDAAGGIPSPLTILDRERGENWHQFAAPLPDGQHFLYLRGSPRDEFAGIYAGRLDRGPNEQPLTRVLPDRSNFVYVPSNGSSAGSLLFVREGVLLAQPFDPIRLTLAGSPVPIIEQVQLARMRGAVEYGIFSASSNGVVAYRPGGNQTELTWFDRAGNRLRTVGEPGIFNMLTLSRSGRQVAVQRRGSPLGYDIWLFDSERGMGTRFTSDRGDEALPVWSPDDSHIAYISSARLVQKASSGAGMEEPIAGLERVLVTDWSRDGRFLLLVRRNQETAGDLWAVDLKGNQKPFPVVRSEFIEAQGQFSPDGRWIAYRSEESGRSEIYVHSFPPSDSGGKWVVSEGGGYQPRWRSDGKELFYFARDGKLMAVAVNTIVAGNNRVFRSGRPVALFTAPIYGGGPNYEIHRWDVAPDGQRFLINTERKAGNTTAITVVLNWREILKK